MSKIFLHYLIIIVVTLALFGCSKEQPSTSIPTPSATTNPPPAPTSPVPSVEDKGYDFSEEDIAGWELVWEDNYDANLFDWTIWSGGAFNNELQHYRASNLFVENDYLFIRQRRGAVNGRTNPFDETQKSFEFSSGRIETKTAYSPSRLGGVIRYAARIKLL